MPMPIGDTPTGTSEQGATADIAALFDTGLVIGPDTKPKTPDADEAEEVAEDDAEQAETPAEDTETAEDDSDHTEDQPSTRKHKLPDGTEVDDDELVRGYLRQSDYTKKTQALADSRKKLDSEEIPAVQKERQEYAAGLTELRTLIEQSVPKEPNWAELKKTLEPGQFADKWAEWQQHQANLGTIKAEEQKAIARVAADQKTRDDADAKAAYERLMELIPEWKDDVKGKAERQDIVKYAETRGFTQQDIAGIRRPELFVVLRDAAAYAKIKSKTAVPPKGTKPASPVLRPGGANERVPAPATEFKKAITRLKKTGSENDAAASIRNLPGFS